MFEYSKKVTIYSKNGSFSDGIKVISRESYFSTDKIYGESIVVDGLSVDAIFKEFGANIIKVEQVDNITCYYGYTSRLPYEIKVFGDKVNLHVAVDGDKIILGTPLIFGSY